ncbi:hypothetical protein ACGFSB_27570 [Streptomyces sp. NPDC048441]|uniref:hypothetical protein n=1 Tax=Streptomyces sp. NPDC048441 TaxID=3365552 RepID=UPI0037199153
MNGSRVVRIAAQAGLTTCLALAPIALGAPSAQAQAACADSYVRPDPYDKGGKDAFAWWISKSNHCELVSDMSFVNFHASNEVLRLRDGKGMSKTRAEVEVFNLRGGLIDKDRIAGEGRHYLGTPDGSRNIDEGLTVHVRVCGSVSGKKTCSKWAAGVS